jgi:hypothetical protein
MPEPQRSRLRQILEEHPDARRRLGREIARLLGIGVATIALMGALLIWHFVRRGRMVRERLGPPRVVRLPDLEPKTPAKSDPEPKPGDS